MIHDFNADGFDSLYLILVSEVPGRARTFTLPERQEIKKIARSRPAQHDLLFSTWSPTKLADFRLRPHRQSWLNRIGPQFTALRYFASDGTTTPTIGCKPA